MWHNFICFSFPYGGISRLRMGNVDTEEPAVRQPMRRNGGTATRRRGGNLIGMERRSEKEAGR